MNKIKQQLVKDAIKRSLDRSEAYKCIHNSLNAIDTKLELPKLDMTLCYLTSVLDDVSNDEITLHAALHQEFTELRKLQKAVIDKFNVINEHLSKIESGSCEDAYKEATFLRDLNRHITESMLYLMAVSTDNIQLYLSAPRNGFFSPPQQHGYGYILPYMFGVDLEPTLSTYARVQIAQTPPITQWRQQSMATVNL